MEKRGRFSKTIIAFFVLFFLWAVLQFLAPMFLPQGSVVDLTGITVIADNEEAISEMPFPWNAIYSTGDSLCHQKADRCLFINENQMPFCSRCTTIWLGLAIGLGFMVFYKIQLDGKFIFAIIMGLVPIGIDGLGQLFGFWESTNAIRVVTGLMIGIVCGIAIGLIIDEIREMRQAKNIKK